MSKQETTLLALRTLFAGSALATNVSKEYERITGSAPPEDPPDERVLFEIGLAYPESPPEEDVTEILQGFEREYLHTSLKNTQEQLQYAERTKDQKSIEDLTKNITTITKRLNTLSI